MLVLGKPPKGRVTECTEPVPSTSTMNSPNLMNRTNRTGNEESGADNENTRIDINTFVKKLNFKEDNLPNMNYVSEKIEKDILEQQKSPVQIYTTFVSTNKLNSRDSKESVLSLVISKDSLVKVEKHDKKSVEKLSTQIKKSPTNPKYNEMKMDENGSLLNISKSKANYANSNHKNHINNPAKSPDELLLLLNKTSYNKLPVKHMKSGSNQSSLHHSNQTYTGKNVYREYDKSGIEENILLILNESPYNLCNNYDGSAKQFNEDNKNIHKNDKVGTPEDLLIILNETPYDKFTECKSSNTKFLHQTKNESYNEEIHEKCGTQEHLLLILNESMYKKLGDKEYITINKNYIPQTVQSDKCSTGNDLDSQSNKHDKSGTPPDLVLILNEILESELTDKQGSRMKDIPVKSNKSLNAPYDRISQEQVALDTKKTNHLEKQSVYDNTGHYEKKCNNIYKSLVDHNNGYESSLHSKSSLHKFIIQGSVNQQDYVLIQGPVFVYRPLINSEQKLIIFNNELETGHSTAETQYSSINLTNQFKLNNNIDEEIQFSTSNHSLQESNSLENLLKMTKKLLDSDYDLTPERECNKKYHYLLVDATTSISGINIKEGMVVNNNFTDNDEDHANQNVRQVRDINSDKNTKLKVYENYIIQQNRKLTSSVSMPILIKFDHRKPKEHSIQLRNKHYGKTNINTNLRKVQFSNEPECSSNLIDLNLTLPDFTLR